MKILRRMPIVVLAISGIGSPVFGEELSPELPRVVQDLVDCKEILEAGARLACYDKQVAAVVSANELDEIVIVDRDQVQEARRGLFGLSLPRIRLFASADEEEIDQIEGKIVSYWPNAKGLTTFALNNGVKWEQVDGRRVRPKKGSTIVIKRASLGSFMARVDNKSAVRVRRLGD
jgi:hypothetical protein